MKHPDLLIAAAAETAEIPLLHYDEDYERIAKDHRPATPLARPQGLAALARRQWCHHWATIPHVGSIPTVSISLGCLGVVERYCVGDVGGERRGRTATLAFAYDLA